MIKTKTHWGTHVSARYYSYNKRRSFLGGTFGALLIGFLFVVISVGVLYRTQRNDTPASAAQTPAVEEAPLPPEPNMAEIMSTQLVPQLNAVIAAYPTMQISISCIDVKSGAIVHAGVAEAFDAASISKLISAIVYLRSVESGEASLTANVGSLPANQQIQLLIEKSDNAAWEALNGHLGHPKLKAYANSNGLTAYDPENNRIVTNEVAKLLEQLYSGKLLNDTHTKLLLDFMSRSERGEYMASALQPGTKVFHKAGWLKDRFHDAAIIDNGQRPYVLVIFTKARGQYDQELGKALFQRVTASTLPIFVNPQHNGQ